MHYIHASSFLLEMITTNRPALYSTGSFERGEAKYFHGRKGILKKLEESMSLVEEDNSGT